MTDSSTGTPAARPTRPVRPQIVLSVARTEWLSPHLVRVVATGDGFGEFQDSPHTDKYVKIRFPAGDAFVTRTYTVRHVDPVAHEISIDFVVHGDEGLAGPWAAHARAGDTISLAGPGGGYTPDPAADSHLLVGDLSALPAIAAALEAMPTDATGLAIIETTSSQDAIDLVAPTGVEVRWMPRGAGDDADASVLATAVASIDWPDGDVQVFAHGERESIKALREVFKARGLTRERLSLSGYWARGRTEDRFQAEKREPVGVIAPL
ncbi:siderophore-interacting protein [Glaciihabitans sp. dw_435]|uniref:siderophore-interacting protein n=1 Tax=Glaciihabitans sp. dw_435 TaxID=2720081 RepID=UPI001BD4E73D|nr:siderophore-interacting protein [Glaciihabitans sp. dw_435]